MTDLAEKKEDVKKKIRSLLLSAPVGLTLQELERDYRTFIGCSLPIREMGYTSTEEYLMSIPDVLQMTRRNGVVVLTGVANAATENIQKLVSKQKVDTRKNWGALGNKTSSSRTKGSRSHGQRWEPTMCTKPWERNDRTTYNQYRKEYLHSSQHQYSRESTSRSARHRTMPSVPAYVQSQIHKLLQSYTDGLSLAEICTIFQKHYGIPLDYLSMGFSSVVDLLASLTDFVKLKQLSRGETLVMSAVSDITMDYEQSCLYVRSNAASRDAFGVEKGHIRSVMSPDLTEPSLGREATSTASQFNNNNLSDLCLICNIPFYVQDQIQEIMADRPKGIWASRLPIEYRNIFKRELPHKTYGYNNVIEFVSDLSHIIKIERPYKEGDWLLLPASVQKSEADIQAKQLEAENRFVKMEVDEQTKERISQVLCMWPDGVTLDKFEKAYKEMTGRTLDINKYGAIDLKHFLHSLSDILYIAPNSSGKLVVSMKVSARPRSFDKLKDQYLPTSRLDIQIQEPFLQLPTDAVSPGCLYSPQSLPEFKEQYLIPLFVSHILSPALFWIQLKGSETTLALEDLMDEMDAVYNYKHLPSTYHMTQSLAEIGMICAAIFPDDGLWYRAVITGVKDQFFEVYYVDYGNVCPVSLTQMRLLKTKFMKLPAQAIRARLSNIQPEGGVWKKNSRNRLLALCRDKPLIGLVAGFKNGVLSLCLTDTTQDFDIHINDVLVSEGYAIFVQDNQDFLTDEHSQAPEIDLLFGKPEPGSTKSKMPSSQRYIRQARMMDDIVMNLINLDGQLYLLSSEISSLFFEEDVLSAQLHKDNIDVPKRVVTRKEHADLFKELAVYGAPNLTTNTSVISLFSLSSLPLIIELYDEKGVLEEVKVTALEVLEWFDPDDPYWKGDDDVDEKNSPEIDSTEADMPSLKDLQLALHSLEIRKRRILKLIMEDSTRAPKFVNELNETELNMNRVQALITKLESALENTGHSQLSECSLPVKTEQAVTLEVTTPELLLPVASSQLKTTHKVAPTMQSSRTEQEPSCSSTVEFSSQAVPDMTALLQQRILLNSLLMEQLGIPKEVNNLSSLMRNLPQQSFGQGISIQQLSQPGLQLQTGNPNTVVTQSFPNHLLPLGYGSVAQQYATNLLKGLGQGMPLELYSPQHLSMTDLFDQSQLPPYSFLQARGQGNPFFQNQQSLQGSRLLEMVKSLNPSLSLNSQPLDNLSYSQSADLQLHARNDISGLMPNLISVAPSWFRTNSGSAPMSLPSGFSSPTPSLVCEAGAANNVGGISKGLSTSSLMQNQQLQQSMPDLDSMMQLLSFGSGANVTSRNTKPAPRM